MQEAPSNDTPAREELTREIASHWSESRHTRTFEDALPAFLSNPMLADRIGQNTNIVVQVLDMRRFKSVYVSPNVAEVTGRSVDEINAGGIWAWFQNLSWKELGFQARNARLLGRVQRGLPPRTQFHSAMLNNGMRHKSGERRRSICQNFTLEWDQSGAQKYQLFLWRDATHLFKGDDVVVRHQWTPPQGAPVVWSFHAEKGKFVQQDLFSEREREVVDLVQVGLETKDIAEKLGISPFTVENHRKNAIARLQVRSTEGLIEICKWLKLL